MSSRAKVLAAAVAAVLLPALLAACPLCKDALEDAKAVPNQLGVGFYYSILLMVSAPFLVVGGLFFKIWRSRRRRGEKLAEESSSPSGFVPDPRGARS